MLQARSSDGSLIITSAPPHELLAGAHSLLKINPGYMKYGWSSEPQQFAPFQQSQGKATTPTKAEAFAAAKLALLGSQSGRQATGTPDKSQSSAGSSEQSATGLVSS